MFSILADVRNGYGFAGIKTGDGFIPMSDPRGVPEDASEEYKEWVDEWGVDGHHHSFHTVSQLIEYPHWDEGTTKCGVVSESEYRTFKENGFPNSYCGDCSGRDIVKVTNEVMDGIINGSFMKVEGKEYFTSVERKDAYKNRASYFYTESIPRLRELAKEDLSSVRIVFFFDN